MSSDGEMMMILSRLGFQILWPSHETFFFSPPREQLKLKLDTYM